MDELFIRAETIPGAYHKSLVALWSHGTMNTCADWNQSQKELSLTMVIDNPLREPMISRLYNGGFYELQQYVMEVIDGILDFEIQAGNWVYTYHDRLTNYDGFNQLDFIVNELTRAPDSRRAVAIMRDNRTDPFHAEAACLQHLQYFIRDDKLHCKVLMRSNDAVKATFMNVFAFVMLQKHIAEKLGVSVGSYTHRANSFHCYERDFALLENYIQRLCDSEYKPEFDYMGYYKDFMDDCIDEIYKKVDNLRARTGKCKYFDVDKDENWSVCISCANLCSDDGEIHCKTSGF